MPSTTWALNSDKSSKRLKTCPRSFNLYNSNMSHFERIVHSTLQACQICPNITLLIPVILVFIVYIIGSKVRDGLILTKAT